MVPGTKVSIIIIILIIWMKNDYFYDISPFRGADIFACVLIGVRIDVFSETVHGR